MNLETYNKSVDILLDAYNSGRLFPEICDACAVGNLLGTNFWAMDFFTNQDGKRIDFRAINPNYWGFKLLDSMYQEKGYTRKELMQIEFVFESAAKLGIYLKERQFLGLQAVLNLLPTLVEQEEKINNESVMEKFNTIYENKLNEECIEV